MSRYDYYDYYPPSQPIKSEKGIKAKSKRGAFVKNWWATRWLHALERLLDAGRLRRGQSYARQGQVLSIEETKSGIAAKVQGSRRTPYEVTIDIDTLNNTQWEQVIDALADQAIFTVQLLAGEMPQEIEEAFKAAGVNLFPEKRQELVTSCSCPDPANPCKHVAAVYYILGEQFDEDPFLLFRLRGRTQEQILAGLRSRRAADTESAADFEDEIEESVTPLAESIANFWEMSQPLTHFKTTIKPPITEFPVLKRLGQPNFLSDDLLRELGPAYRAITASAILMAFKDDTETVED
jgi:uncharacterized Zn finger protein